MKIRKLSTALLAASALAGLPAPALADIWSTSTSIPAPFWGDPLAADLNFALEERLDAAAQVRDLLNRTGLGGELDRALAAIQVLTGFDGNATASVRAGANIGYQWFTRSRRMNVQARADAHGWIRGPFEENRDAYVQVSGTRSRSRLTGNETYSFFAELRDFGGEVKRLDASVDGKSLLESFDKSWSRFEQFNAGVTTGFAWAEMGLMGSASFAFDPVGAQGTLILNPEASISAYAFPAYASLTVLEPRSTTYVMRDPNDPSAGGYPVFGGTRLQADLTVGPKLVSSAWHMCVRSTVEAVTERAMSIQSSFASFPGRDIGARREDEKCVPLP